MVVGHTPQRNGINSVCDGDVWRIDVGLSRAFAEAYPSRRTEVLEIQGEVAGAITFEKTSTGVKFSSITPNRPILGKGWRMFPHGPTWYSINETLNQRAAEAICHDRSAGTAELANIEDFKVLREAFGFSTKYDFPKWFFNLGKKRIWTSTVDSSELAGLFNTRNGKYLSHFRSDHAGVLCVKREVPSQ